MEANARRTKYRLSARFRAAIIFAFLVVYITTSMFLAHPATNSVEDNDVISAMENQLAEILRAEIEWSSNSNLTSLSLHSRVPFLTAAPLLNDRDNSVQSTPVSTERSISPEQIETIDKTYNIEVIKDTPLPKNHSIAPELLVSSSNMTLLSVPQQQEINHDKLRPVAPLKEAVPASLADDRGPFGDVWKPVKLTKSDWMVYLRIQKTGSQTFWQTLQQSFDGEVWGRHSSVRIFCIHTQMLGSGSLSRVFVVEKTQCQKGLFCGHRCLKVAEDQIRDIQRSRAARQPSTGRGKRPDPNQCSLIFRGHINWYASP
jgi:hypothetical protein